MPKLSIIIPVYNAEPFLKRCIESVLNQALLDFELFLIDDGSSDYCGVICDEYAAKDDRIKVFHQNNKGVSAARNLGLAQATGKFITFVDADDAVDRVAYSEMIQKAETVKAEIVCCGVQYYSESGAYKRSDLAEEFVCNRDEMLKALFSRPDPLGGSCCNKIFLRETIGGVRYQEDVEMGEDWLFLFEAFSRSSLQYKMPGTYYWVTEHENSSSRRIDVSIPIRILRTSKMMMKKGKAYSDDMGSIATDKYLDDCLRYMAQIKKYGTQNGQSYRWKMFCQKADMLFVTLDAAAKRSLSKEKIHGYLYGLLTCCKE